MPGPYHGWMAIKDRHGKVYEIFNHARLASYLAKPAFPINGLDPCSILDLGGCANYASLPTCEEGWIDFPGTATANYLSAPDAANLDIVGDVTLVARVALDDWTPAVSTAIVGKRSTGAAGPYELRVAVGGTLQFVWWDGTTQLSALATVVTPVTDGSWKWVASTFDANNGAAGRSIRFWTSNDGSTWTQLGTTVTQAGVTQIAATTDALNIGALGNGTFAWLGGKVSYVSVRDGIGAAGVVGGTEVFRFDAQTDLVGVQPSATSFTSSDTANRFVYFPGVSGNYLSIPDAAPLDIVGDISIAARVRAVDWAAAANAMVVSKWVSAPNFAYRLYLLSGALRFEWSNDGTTVLGVTSSSHGIPNNTWKWVGVTLDVDNAGSRTVKFYLSDDGTTWTQLGSDSTTAGVTSIQPTTSNVTFGGNNGGTGNLLTGRLGHVAIRSGLSATSPVGGTEVFRFDGGTDLNGVAIAATSFSASTGQVVTVNRSGSPQTELVNGRQTVTVNRSSSPSTTIVPAAGTWINYTYNSPATDPAPWYNAAYPESANALGFMLEEWTGLDDQHVTRTSTPWGGYGGGVNIGPVSAGGRTMGINMMLFGTTEEAVDYLFRWLGGVFNAVCATCDTDTMLIRRYCGSTATPEAGIAELRKVGIQRGLGWESDITPWGNCQIRRASIILQAGDPCMYLPEAQPTVTASTITNLNACFADADVNLDPERSICRPTCSELETTCRSTWSWQVAPMAAIAPIIVFDNPTNQHAFPFRATVYADPNLAGAANPCGLETLGQIYVRALPPWSTLTWDVAGREVRYRDHNTGADVPTATYLEPNDPPNRRYFAQGCAQAHLVVEPATLCVDDLGSNNYETGGLTFASPTFPSVTVTTQERVSCA